MKTKRLANGDRCYVKFSADFRKKFPHTTRMFDAKACTYSHSLDGGRPALCVVMVIAYGNREMVVDRDHLVETLSETATPIPVFIDCQS